MPLAVALCPVTAHNSQTSSTKGISSLSGFSNQSPRFTWRAAVFIDLTVPLSTPPTTPFCSGHAWCLLPSPLPLSPLLGGVHFHKPPNTSLLALLSVHTQAFIIPSKGEKNKRSPFPQQCQGNLLTGMRADGFLISSMAECMHRGMQTPSTHLFIPYKILVPHTFFFLFFGIREVQTKME